MSVHSLSGSPTGPAASSYVVPLNHRHDLGQLLGLQPSSLLQKQATICISLPTKIPQTPFWVRPPNTVACKQEICTNLELYFFTLIAPLKWSHQDANISLFKGNNVNDNIELSLHTVHILQVPSLSLSAETVHNMVTFHLQVSRRWSLTNRYKTSSPCQTSTVLSNQ